VQVVATAAERLALLERDQHARSADDVLLRRKAEGLGIPLCEPKRIRRRAVAGLAGRPAPHSGPVAPAYPPRHHRPVRIDRTDLAFLVFAAGSGAACAWLGGLEAIERALGSAGWTLVTIVPLFAAGLLLSGFVQQLVPRDRVQHWLGAASGLRGLLIAVGIGVVTPGGPFTSFPLVVALAEAGADIGVLVAYLTSWSVLGLNRILVWEIPLMGWDFVVLRVAASLPLALIAGLAARAVAARIAARPQRSE